MNQKKDSIDNQKRGNSLIGRTFGDILSKRRIALMPFVMAGDPDLDTTAEILLELQSAGADMIELGIPYSDPLADGPVIQAAASRSLKAGTTPTGVLKMLESIKTKLHIPIILFTYSNPLLSRGMSLFCEEASQAGATGLVVPDLPLEEAKTLSPIAESNGIDLILLVAPTTPITRMKMISKMTKGFTYLVSVTGVTGERVKLDDRVANLVRDLKNISSKPIAIGFGISTEEHVDKVRSWGADGAIVGSALVNKIFQAPRGSESIDAGSFCKQLHKATSKNNQ